MNVASLENGALDGSLVGRSQSIFAEDILTATNELADLIAGSRILFIGAAGSIGLNTLRTIACYKPAALHVIDHNENGLAEVVRTLRSGSDEFCVDEFVLQPFDYGSLPFRSWIRSQSKPYDFVLNFAALKHVRSEKDPYSILAMLETNVLKLDSFPATLEGKAPPKRVFCVSTDKAANPSSMMGATKRLMEHALFGSGRGWSDQTAITSARFANVALSNGSLLQSWRNRLEQRQPMACPKDCRRYFVTLKEAGHLCTLAGLLGQAGTILVPKLDPKESLVLLQRVSEVFLQQHGYKPYFTEDEEEARYGVEAAAAQGQWPVLVTPLDTAGEKPFEEFVATGEKVEPTRFKLLDQVPYQPLDRPESFGEFVARIKEILSDAEAAVTLERIKDEICMVEEAFRASHVVSRKSLDQRV